MLRGGVAGLAYGGPVTECVVALLDGTVQPVDVPLLRPDDLAVLRGEGVFETTLAVRGEPRDLDDHLARLAVSAELTDVTVPAPDRWRTAVEAALSAWSSGRATDGQTPDEAVVRLIAPRGPEASPEAAGYVLVSGLPAVSRRQRATGVRVVLLDRGFTPSGAAAAPWLLAQAKTLSYGINMAALRWARSQGADDAIFVAGGADATHRSAGERAVLEAPTSSVVLARRTSSGERTLVTPLTDGVLDGITVRRLLSAAGAAGWATTRETVTVDDLHAADGIWLVSSARLVAPVTAIDGRPLDDGGLTPEIAALLDVPGS